MTLNSLPQKPQQVSRTILFGAGAFLSKFITDSAMMQALENYGFNSITTGNFAFRWNSVQPEEGKFLFEEADAVVAFAKTKNLHVHGHTLLWNNKMMPQWVLDKAKTVSRDEFKAILKNHLQTVVKRYKGRVHSYDVANEIITDKNNILATTLGEEYLELAFRWVHEVDPDAKLFYNDNRIESAILYSDNEANPSQPKMNPKATKVYNVIRSLKAKGVPIHGVGFQSHVFGARKNITEQEILDQILKYKAIGVEVAISEMDVELGTDKPTEAQLVEQADIYRRYANACVRSQNCYRFTTWGVHDGHSWVNKRRGKPDAPLLLDRSYQPKSAYTAVTQALKLNPPT